MDSIGNKASKKTLKKRKLGTDPQQVCFQKVQFVTVESDHEGRRIDNFLFNFFKGIPKGRIYKMLRKGEVRVNKKRISANYRLISKDQLRLPPVFLDEKSELSIPHRIIEQLKINTLYEDNAFLIINKPSGIPVHAGSGFDFGVIEAMRTTPEFKDGYIELAHRLDRETSGCLILVKQAPVLRQMNLLIKNSRMSKQYIALLKGVWQGGTKEINMPLIKGAIHGERIMRINKEGKEARTEFSLRQGFSTVSLMDVTLHTGRTHQIRVHSQYMKMPIAGDSKYGDDDFNKKIKKLGLRRLFLHASRLEFQLDGMQRISVEAPLPDDLQTMLKKL